MGVFALAFGTQVFYMGREWEENELKSKKMVCFPVRLFIMRRKLSVGYIQKIEDAPSTRWARTSTRFADVFNVCIMLSPKGVE